MGYNFIVSDLFKGFTAEEAYNELTRIQEKYGVLEPGNVVNESKSKDALFHSVFEWDDTAAANKYRIQQAKKLISNITVTINNKKIETNVRCWVNVRTEKDAPKKYIPFQEVVSNDYAYKCLLADAKKDLQSFATKYSQLSELNKVKASILEFLSE